MLIWFWIADCEAAENMFHCESGGCVRDVDTICDSAGFEDCWDGSDEKDCLGTDLLNNDRVSGWK